MCRSTLLPTVLRNARSFMVYEVRCDQMMQESVSAKPSGVPNDRERNATTSGYEPLVDSFYAIAIDLW